MDRNTIIGLVAIMAILIGFGIYNKPSEKELKRQEHIRDSISIVEQQKASQEALKDNKYGHNGSIGSASQNDSVRKANEKKEYGAFASAVEGKVAYSTLENNKVKITFSNLGGRPYCVQLKEYHTYDSLPLHLFSGDSTVFGFSMSSIDKNTNSMFFNAVNKNNAVVVSKTKESVVYRLQVDSSKYIEYVYTLAPNDYMMKLDVHFRNMQDVLGKEYLTFKWETYSPQQEKGRQWEDQNTSLHYQYVVDDEHNDLSPAAEEKSEKLTGKVKWVAFKQQFFSAILIADSSFDGGTVVSNKLITSTKHLKKFAASLDINSTPQNVGMSFYFGPNKYKVLQSHNLGLEKLVPLGWGIFGWVNKYGIIPIFNFLCEYMSNYGLIIFILTIIIKVVLSPLTFKSYLSTAKMRVLKPEVEEISKKFPKKEDALKKQQATMEMYKKAGTNPMSGCLPMLVQLPILFAMFRFFPAAIELRQKSFLWASDLSSYDSIFEWKANIPLISSFYGNHISLFTLLMAGSMILINLSSANTMVSAPGQPNMKWMMWLMPFMMLFMFNKYSSGLTYYYFLANMITVIQTWIIQRNVDDKKILAQIHENRKKPVKKSSFQQKLEDMARQRGMKLK
jgi:YidC/Oxa1 family membrane protein insertase